MYYVLLVMIIFRIGGCNAGGVPFCAGIQASGFGETTIGTTVTPPSWAKGSTQETAWNAWVNHGGGHIYMLCKKSAFDLCRETFLPSNPLQASKDQNDAYLKCVWDCFGSVSRNTSQDVPRVCSDGFGMFRGRWPQSTKTDNFSKIEISKIRTIACGF